MQQINKNNLNGWAIGLNLFSWIQENIPLNETIIELGSGIGTHELGKLYKVHCVEHNPQWVDKFDNLTYYYAPIKEGWYDRDKLNDLPKHYSLLILDGPPGNIGRTKVLENLDLFSLDVPVIIDDTHRKVELDIAHHLKNKLGKKSFIIKDKDKEAIILI